MYLQILLNMVIAVIWAFLQNSFTVGDFLIGYGIGIIILYVVRHLFHGDFYLRRVIALIKLTLLFCKELLLANWSVIKIVLSPKLDVQSGIIAVPTQLKTDLEISLLAALITLTPGTLSMDFSDDNQIIYVHAIDVPNKEDMIKDIQQSFERAIMEVTR